MKVRIYGGDYSPPPGLVAGLVFISPMYIISVFTIVDQESCHSLCVYGFVCVRIVRLVLRLLMLRLWWRLLRTRPSWSYLWVRILNHNRSLCLEGCSLVGVIVAAGMPLRKPRYKK